jgi:hypothetical protein
MPVARATGFYLTKHPPFSCRMRTPKYTLAE